jgi:arginine repressor
MPANKEDQERRREAIRNLLLSGKFPLEDLKAVVEMLKVLGIPASPASVSRDLRELGAVRVKGYYKIPPGKRRTESLRSGRSSSTSTRSWGPDPIRR